MNADTFNTYSPICPVCHRAGAAQPPKLIAGLLTCQSCRERLVVSWSGHYVRDPFTRQLTTERMLRRESHPIARLYRDLKSTSRPFVVAIVGTAVLLGTALCVLQATSSSVQAPTTSTRVTEMTPNSTTE